MAGSEISKHIGDTANGDYVSIDKTGIRHRGNSTVWKDMVADLFGRRLSSPGVGTVDYDFDENAIVFSPSGTITTQNDRVGGNQEINHEFKEGSITIKPHIHWWQQVTTNTVKAVVFTARYRLQRNNAAKTSSWTTITASVGSGGDDVFDFTSEADGLYNQITSFGDVSITCSISDTIQFQLTRTDAETGDVSVFFFDIHGEVDSSGSDGIFTKTV